MIGPLFGEIVAGIIGGAALIAALALLGRALWWVWARVLRPLARLIDDWMGEPERDGVSPRPGVLARLASLESGVATLKGQAEAVARLERRMAAMESRLPPPDGQPRMEAGGTGFQAERAFEVEDVNDARAIYGFKLVSSKQE